MTARALRSLAKQKQKEKCRAPHNFVAAYGEIVRKNFL